MEYERILRVLKKTRKNKGITLRGLAPSVGVSPQTLCYIENNKVPLKMKEYLAICKALDVHPKELLVVSTIKEERWNTAIRMELLQDRDYRIIKDLVMLMTLKEEDL